LICHALASGTTLLHSVNRDSLHGMRRGPLIRQKGSCGSQPGPSGLMRRFARPGTPVTFVQRCKWLARGEGTLVQRRIGPSSGWTPKILRQTCTSLISPKTAPRRPTSSENRGGILRGPRRYEQSADAAAGPPVSVARIVTASTRHLGTALAARKLLAILDHEAARASGKKK